MNEEPNWRTSSYTKSDTCVEVADNNPVKVRVRDSKRRQGAELGFPPASWIDFVEFSKTLEA
ncbi:DUF397 domain-containing protein [Streptomyces sp. Da 82-17]|uniref:DUF397 domain-containing protein n=1 Tax=Streptomyces sp. Da 82-17 TaxID=3377116 RepID=UPI0038D3B2B1